MGYSTTSKEFFETTAKQLVTTPALKEVGVLVEFDIEGAQGGTWFVDCAKGEVSTRGSKPKCIVRAADRDFMALVEGRMSVSDGIVSQRLHIAGEAAALVRLFEAIQGLAPSRP
jgi:hypothetical protein